jgi:hypothetical protein
MEDPFFFAASIADTFVRMMNVSMYVQGTHNLNVACKNQAKTKTRGNIKVRDNTLAHFWGLKHEIADAHLKRWRSAFSKSATWSIFLMVGSAPALSSSSTASKSPFCSCA